MIRNIMNKKSKKKGFTLIELIIVIAILAILAAVAIPKFMEVRNNANVKSDIANAKNIHTAAATLLADEKIDADKSYELKSGATDAATTIIGNLDSVSTAKASANKGKNFFVNVSDKGEITITVAAAKGSAGAVEVYPNGSGDYAK